MLRLPYSLRFVSGPMLKWEMWPIKKHANRWIILIAYLMGLSIGVHLLNLLTIPALVLIYYFRKYEVSKWGIAKALAIGIVILAALFFIHTPWNSCNRILVRICYLSMALD